MNDSPPWLNEPALQQLFAATHDMGGEARVVGGAVRDHLLGRSGGDVDIASTLPPESTIAIAQAAGWKAVPTGIAHGTVTLVLPSRVVELEEGGNALFQRQADLLLKFAAFHVGEHLPDVLSRNGRHVHALAPEQLLRRRVDVAEALLLVDHVEGVAHVFQGSEALPLRLLPQGRFMVQRYLVPADPLLPLVQ